jgi:hypothetical protein
LDEPSDSAASAWPAKHAAPNSQSPAAWWHLRKLPERLTPMPMTGIAPAQGNRITSGLTKLAKCLFWSELKSELLTAGAPCGRDKQT